VKMYSAVAALAVRFDRMSLRARVLTSAAALVVLIALFQALVFQRLELRRKQLAQQLTQIVADINDSAGTGDGSDAGATLQRATALAAQLGEATAHLDSRSAGLIPPQRMTQVIHDVLSRQQGVTLVSLQSLAPYALIDGSGSEDAAAGSAATDTAAPTAVASAGPYVHSVQMVLQGHYLDVLAYLATLERLPWHFYWQSLTVDATHYPTTRVTVKLGTVSMSREWIDL
jgi:MSHA biogenesis protein MshJ